MCMNVRVYTYTFMLCRCSIGRYCLIDNLLFFMIFFSVHSQSPYFTPTFG